MTLEEYFKEYFVENKTDHALRCHVSTNGEVSFYIHGHGFNSQTLDFIVKGNQLIEKKQQ